TEAELREQLLKSLGVSKQLGPEIQWIHSYVTDDKVYCIYFAPTESLIFEPRAESWCSCQQGFRCETDA
ncbi:MAG: nickel-binding protein, partial [Bryobacteraceae bacterium]